MAGIDRTPPPEGTAAARMHTYRAAHFVSARAEHRGEEQLERELRELDDAILGTDAEELARLRTRLHARNGSA